MKAAILLIEILTQGQTDYDEIAQVLGVSKPTACRICRGRGFRYETATKIANAFPYATASQLFRRPFKPFETCQRLLRAELTANGALSAETKMRIQRKHWKLSNP